MAAAYNIVVLRDLVSVRVVESPYNAVVQKLGF